MSSLYMALYSPSSVQKLLDFLKTIYTVNGLVPVVIKPFGAAAQVGVPEAHKLSYKLGKPLIILPELRDIREIIGCNRVYYVVEDGVEIEFSRVIEESKTTRVAVVLGSGEQEPSRKEIEEAELVWFKNIPVGIPPVSLAGILVYEYSRYREKS